MVVLSKMAVVKLSLNYTYKVMLSVSQRDTGFKVNTTSFFFTMPLHQNSSAWGLVNVFFVKARVLFG